MSASTLVAILTAGLTNGAIYALATVGLALVWGSMGMLNMAHGALLALGGYAAYTTVTTLGLPAPLGLIGAMLAGAAAGALLYATVVRQLLRHPVEVFETNVLIATVGVGIALENTILKVYGGQPLRQPVAVPGLVRLGASEVPVQNIAIVLMALAIMGGVAWLLGPHPHGPSDPGHGAEPGSRPAHGRAGQPRLFPGFDLVGHPGRPLRRARQFHHRIKSTARRRPHAQGLHHVRRGGARQSPGCRRLGFRPVSRRGLRPVRRRRALGVPGPVC